MGNKEALSEYGARILTESKNELFLSMRFLGRSLDALPYQMDLLTERLGTDAECIHFNPNFVFQLFLESPQKLDRLYLHIVLHCIFHHMFKRDEYKDEKLWNLAADIQVESVLDSMDYDIIRRPPYPFREEWYERLTAECKVLTAERIYHYFSLNKQDLDTEQMLIQEFTKDDHQFWAKLSEKGSRQQALPNGVLPDDYQTPSGDSSNASDQQSGSDAKEADTRTEDRSVDQQNKNQRDDDRSPSGAKKPAEGRLRRIPEEELDQRWKDTAERMKTELETFSKEKSEETGSLSWVLSAQYREETDFREFLNQLMILREVPKVDPDSFDYGYYNYGMEVYGNMPLVEENEFREERKIADLVIAIDTSASTEETEVQKFLDETAAMLRNKLHFFEKIQVHLILADDQVQDDIVLTHPEEIEDYAARFKMKGGYGTDFRPVFQYVDKLRKAHALPDLRGLLYFTDGYGTYPEKPPAYHTAFVLDPLGDTNEKDIPRWALKLYLKS